MLTVVRLLHKRGFRHNHLPVLVVRQKLEVGIRNPALQCKLPILSYGVEVWDVKSSLGEAAEMLFEDFVGDHCRFASGNKSSSITKGRLG